MLKVWQPEVRTAEIETIARSPARFVDFTGQGLPFAKLMALIDNPWPGIDRSNGLTGTD